MSDQPRPSLPLSMFTRAGDTIYVAGHGAVDSTGKFVSDEFEGQMRYTMEQLGKTLASAGARWDQVKMVRGYVQSREFLPVYNKVYREYFSEPYPARTTIINCLPEGLLFEIDCVAYVGS